MSKLTLHSLNILITCTVAACTPLPTPSPPQICATADACISLNEHPAKPCKFRPGFSDIGYSVGNSHPSKNVWVKIRNTKDYTGNPGRVEFSEVDVPVAANDNVFLGCKQGFDIGTEGSYLARYSPGPSCFFDECRNPPKVLNPIVTNNGRTCEQKCTSGDKTCMRLDINSMAQPILTKELSDVWQFLSSASIPSSLATPSLVTAARAYTPSSQCTRDDMKILPGPTLIWGGTSCTVGFSISGGPANVTSIELVLDGAVSSPVVSKAGGFSLPFGTVDSPPKLRVGFSGAAPSEPDELSRVDGGSGAGGSKIFWLSSKRGLCAQVITNQRSQGAHLK